MWSTVVQAQNPWEVDNKGRIGELPTTGPRHLKQKFAAYARIQFKTVLAMKIRQDSLDLIAAWT